MFEMLLVPLIALGMLVVPLGSVGERAHANVDPAAGPETETGPEDAEGRPETFVTRETAGLIFRGSDAGVVPTQDAGVYDVSGTALDDNLTVAETDVRFVVSPGDGADLINIALNSDVSMGEPVFGEPTEFFPPEVDSAADIVLEQADSADNDADHITLAITQDGIDRAPEAPRVSSRVDLSDPNDSLSITLSDQVQGNLHTIEIEEDAGGEMVNNRGLFTLVVLTEPDVSSLTYEQARGIAWGEATDISAIRLVLVNQGMEYTARSFDAGLDTFARQNDLNENPLITANREFASQSRVLL
jgi:hypothetical protein